MMKQAIEHLSRDPIMKQLIESTSLNLEPRTESVYESLLQSIIAQQLSVKAAARIHERFIHLFKDQYPAPEELLSLEVETLRGAGLSRQKAGYVQNVADFFIKEKLLKNKDWSSTKDEEIIKQLTRIKGVGKWTVQMMLLFSLDRPDVFPIDDLGIQQGMIKLYGLEGKYAKDRQGQKAMRKQMLEVSAPWSPFRTLACKYLWQGT